MRVVILGAGASIGFDSSRPKWEIPPSSTGILERARSLGILDDENFRDLSEGAKQFRASHGPPLNAETETDIEEFLGWLGAEFENNRGPQSQSGAQSQSFNAQAALGQAIYLIYEVLRGPVSAYIPRDDAYARLARSYWTNPFGVISLNYDTLFDIAAQSIVRATAYSGTLCAGILSISKLHGSVNWINSSASSVIARIGGKPAGRDFAMRMLWSNRFYMRPLMIAAPDAIRIASYRDLVPDSDNLTEVALIPPVGPYKDYGKIKFYKEVEDLAKAMVSRVRDLVIIGTRLRAQDQKLCELVQEALRHKPTVTIVGNRDAVGQRLREMDPSVEISTIAHFEKFEEFARTL
jgi:hypothetical protein